MSYQPCDLFASLLTINMDSSVPHHLNWDQWLVNNYNMSGLIWEVWLPYIVFTQLIISKGNFTAFFRGDINYSEC